jgi:hypothetical protein
MSSRFVLREGLAMRRIYSIDGGMGKHLCALRVAAREPCGPQGRGIMLCLAARLKPCPDTCMGCGCGVAVQADRQLA